MDIIHYMFRAKTIEVYYKIVVTDPFSDCETLFPQQK